MKVQQLTTTQSLMDHCHVYVQLIISWKDILHINPVQSPLQY